jgi:predicted enzyme related to lactoylglutathione lyase
MKKYRGKVGIFLMAALSAAITVTGYTAEKLEQTANEKLMNSAKSYQNPIRFEHLGLNCVNQIETADWYMKYMGLVELWQKDNRRVIYIGDADGNFSLELYTKEAKDKLSNLNTDAFHIAFEGNDIEALSKKMIEGGSIQIGKTSVSAIGDVVIDIADPWGNKLQLIHRKEPFFTKPVKSSLRFEHIGLNVENQMVTALWYSEFMGLVIPFSKDPTGPNKSSNYRAPYVGDPSGHMSLELYSKPKTAVGNYGALDTTASHLAFAVNDAATVAAKMVKGGATQLATPNVNTVGDVVIDLRDPWGVNIQLVQRKAPFLK